LCRGFRPAQEKLFPFVQVFMDHVGIQELNVADTIAEVLRNNAPLLMQVRRDLLSLSANILDQRPTSLQL
jgi:hypothetical protein